MAYIWHAGTKAGIVQDSLAACGFDTRSQIIWAKNNFAIGRLYPPMETLLTLADRNRAAQPTDR